MKLINLFVPLSLAAQALSGPTPITTNLQTRARPGFAYTHNGDIRVDGKTYAFGSTNAYWLTQLNTDDDIRKVLVDIANQGSRVVRAWCFREVVGARPSNSATYTAVWQNGKQILNQPGLDRIKFILDQADSLGLKVHCSLTNNWAPTYPSDSPRPLGYYSNSYGGVDTYVHQLKPGGHHDDFFTDATIKAQYKVFLRWIVNELKDQSSLFGWELINDAQCRGATGTTTSGNCKTTTITSWVNELASFVKSIDPDHILSAGDQGFFCTVPSSCPKINPVHNSRLARRISTRRGLYLTADDLEDRRRAEEGEVDASAHDRRAKPGAAFDGSFGVDTEDILNSPHVDFSSFHFFPDQVTYSAGSDTGGPPPGGAGGPNFASTLKQGIDWINEHAASKKTFGKPTVLAGYGYVSAGSASDYQPFNSTSVGPSNFGRRRATDTPVTEQQKQTAVDNMGMNAVKQGINGLGSHQEGTSGLTSVKGTVIDNSNTSGNSGSQASVNGRSPDDGYSNTQQALKNTFSAIASAQNAKS